ncbi:MAG: hypothetical protein UT53_C0001G0019 [Candidatus Yanofskybacteria bacterium GW2011_GWD2_39_48]|uniref:Uncharacterized protein n=1 Tax=Candidatus Yanofskybacteria bacterium GW2011_GWD2_39_48 TaxID=1619031 RepID=A0A0G0RNB1_9BACT|nr:MAG: hypothetical protein UT53_C0001G0019 [Candidatus Yanofskybacteria bacterium GW2011_GWD2_39_48]
MANGKNEKKRLEPRQVVMAAYQYLQSILTQQRISEPRIEELEPFDDKNNFWTVVLSYDALGELPFEKKREYKEFKVDAYSGDIAYMKIFDRNKQK